MCDRFYGGRETFWEGGTPPSVSIEISPLTHKKIESRFQLACFPKLESNKSRKNMDKKKVLPFKNTTSARVKSLLTNS